MPIPFRPYHRGAGHCLFAHSTPLPRPCTHRLGRYWPLGPPRRDLGPRHPPTISMRGTPTPTEADNKPIAPCSLCPFVGGLTLLVVPPWPTPPVRGTLGGKNLTHEPSSSERSSWATLACLGPVPAGGHQSRFACPAPDCYPPSTTLIMPVPPPPTSAAAGGWPLRSAEPLPLRGRPDLIGCAHHASAP